MTTRPTKPHQVDRPMAADPRGQMSNPTFQVHSMADNGLWDSERGELCDPYFDPTQQG